MKQFLSRRTARIIFIIGVLVTLGTIGYVVTEGLRYHNTNHLTVES